MMEGDHSLKWAMQPVSSREGVAFIFGIYLSLLFIAYLIYLSSHKSKI